MQVHVVTQSDAAGWDNFIRQFHSCGPLHTRAWTECFRSEHLTPLYLRLMSNDQPLGAIAGLIVDPRLSILRTIDRTAFFFSGPALAKIDSVALRSSFESLKGFAREQGFTSLVSLGRDYPYAYDWGDSRVHLQTIQEYFIDLGGSWEQIRAKMRRSIPEQVRKAERSGLTFHAHRNASMLHQLLPLLENTRARRRIKSGIHFSPYYIPHLAEEPLKRLGQSDIARFYVARRDSEVLCVLLTFSFYRRAYALTIGCSEEGYRLRAPAFVYFNAMRHLKEEGVETLDLAGGGPQSGHSFAKTSLGAMRLDCTGSVSPYLKGPVRNLLFQTARWATNLITN